MSKCQYTAQGLYVCKKKKEDKAEHFVNGNPRGDFMEKCHTCITEQRINSATNEATYKTTCMACQDKYSQWSGPIVYMYDQHCYNKGLTVTDDRRLLCRGV